MDYFELYYSLTGSLGIGCWFSYKLLPWVTKICNFHYFRAKFNKMFFLCLFVAVISYFVVTRFDWPIVLFILLRIALGLSSIYALIIGTDWIASKASMRFDVTVGALAGMAWLVLLIYAIKSFILPDILTRTQTRIISFTQSTSQSVLVGYYHEYDPFTYQSDGDFLLQLKDEHGVLKSEYRMSENRGFGWYHSLAETGQLFIVPLQPQQASAHQSSPPQTSKVNLNIVHTFRPIKLILRNHWFLRHALPYTFLVFSVFFFTPQRQIRSILMQKSQEFDDTVLPPALDDSVRQLIFTPGNPITATRLSLQHFFMRIGIAQMRFTAKSNNKLYAQVREFLQTKYDTETLKQKIGRVGLEHEVEVARLKAEKSKYKRDKRQYDERPKAQPEVKLSEQERTRQAVKEAAAKNQGVREALEDQLEKLENHTFQKQQTLAQLETIPEKTPETQELIRVLQGQISRLEHEKQKLEQKIRGLP